MLKEKKKKKKCRAEKVFAVERCQLAMNLVVVAMQFGSLSSSSSRTELPKKCPDRQ